MKAPDRDMVQTSPVAPPADVGQLISAWRLQGADRMDPVGWHYIEVLAQRAQAHSGRARQLLDGKLAEALVAFRTRFEQAQRDAPTAIDLVAPPTRATSLAGLIRHISEQLPESVEGDLGVASGAAHPELKTTRYFRQTWSKLSVDKRMAQALDQAPKNAGPINSHRLVLQSLALMRDISPDYLGQFTSYIDTLLYLDQGDPKSRVLPKRPPRGKSIKKN